MLSPTPSASGLLPSEFHQANVFFSPCLTPPSLRGATHFTHIFQPQTGATAEKHDSFLTLRSVVTSNGEEVSFGVIRG